MYKSYVKTTRVALACCVPALLIALALQPGLGHEMHSPEAASASEVARAGEIDISEIRYFPAQFTNQAKDFETHVEAF